MDLQRHERAGHPESHPDAATSDSWPPWWTTFSRIEAVSYEGVGVEKVYLHEGADVTRAVSQLASSALVVLKYMPPNITPPLVLRYGATDVPIIQLSLSSRSLPDSKLNDLGQNIIRPALAVVHGAEVPYPYGGKPRVIMADLDLAALSARGLSPADVSGALQRQNVILPAGDVKIGDKDYALAMNNSPNVIDSINAFPIKQIDGSMVFMRDVAHVHDGFQVQTNSVSVNGTPGALMTIRKTGRRVDTGGDRWRPCRARRHPGAAPQGCHHQGVVRPVHFCPGGPHSVLLSAAMAAGLTALVSSCFWATCVCRSSSSRPSRCPSSGGAVSSAGRADSQYDDSRRLCAGDRHPGRQRHRGDRKHRAPRGMREPLHQAIVTGASEVRFQPFCRRCCICIVFVPVFLLQGTASTCSHPCRSPSSARCSRALPCPSPWCGAVQLSHAGRRA